jgi:hypothetical protein
MYDFKFGAPLTLFWLQIAIILCLFCIPTYGAEPIDGFRDLKFGMSPQEVQALASCSSPYECMYELSDKNRYVQLTYDSNDLTQDLKSSKNLQLAKATIDMGHYSEEWYQHLQMILGKSYRLTHDFTDDTMNAFLNKQSDELQEGFEDGQVVLTVIRRQYGNMVLKVIYQNRILAAKFIQQSSAPPTTRQ